MSKFVVKIAGSIPITSSVTIEAKDEVTARKLAVKKYKTGVIPWDPFDGTDIGDIKVLTITKGD